jgi:ribosome recycling factor
VNNKYNYYSIQPFDTIKVKNIDYSIDNLQVLKVTYQKDGAVLDIEKLENLGTI